MVFDTLLSDRAFSFGYNISVTKITISNKLAKEAAILPLLLPLFPVLVPLPVVLVEWVLVVSPVVAELVAVVVLVVPPLKQFDALTTLVSSVTAPVRAMARPVNAALRETVTLVCAKILPLNAVELPIVAEPPTCQKTLHGFAPLMRRTAELAAVTRVLVI